MPHNRGSRPGTPPGAVDLDAFYSADVEKMAAFLGPEMHFHHGLASPEVDELLGRSTGTPSALDEHAASKPVRSLEDAVRVLYPHIPLGAHVLDVGCGNSTLCAQLAADGAAPAPPQPAGSCLAPPHGHLCGSSTRENKSFCSRPLPDCPALRSLVQLPE